MGLIRLIVIALLVIGAVMYWFGRDEGLPENRLGYDPEPPETETQLAENAAQPQDPPEEAADAGAVTPEPAGPAAVPPATETAGTAGSDAPDIDTTATAPGPESEPEAPATGGRPVLTLPVSDPPVVIPGVPTAVLTGPGSATQPRATPAPEPEPEPEAEPEPALPLRYITGAVVNLREASSTGTPVVARLPRGTEVELIGPAPDEGWSEVRVSATGEAGFIASRFLSPDRP